jgi:hypothetical protein
MRQNGTTEQRGTKKVSEQAEQAELFRPLFRPLFRSLTI